MAKDTKILVTTMNPITSLTKDFIFNDWYELADYIKEENENIRSVNIIHWRYLRKQGDI